MDTLLRGQTILVTGASGGIGSAICELLLEEGANVVAHAHANRLGVEALERQAPQRVLAVQADLRDAEQTEGMFSSAIERFSRIDSIVANAGVWPTEHAAIDELPLERWRDTMSSDLDSVAFTCARFFAHLRSQPRDEASVVIIGSTAAVFGEEGHSDYAAAKAAITFGLTRTLKNEIVRLAKFGRVNAVCPGWTATPMSDAQIENDAQQRKVFATMPLAKIATPRDIANLVVFLCSSNLAGHISGQVVTVAGGMEGRMLHQP